MNSCYFDQNAAAVDMNDQDDQALMDRLFRIVSYASEVAKDDPFEPIHVIDDDAFPSDLFEPTPIGPNGLDSIVEQVTIPSLFANGAYDSNNYRSAPSSFPPQDVTVTSLSAGENNGSNRSSGRRFQTAQWDQRFSELLQFRKETGHLFVPHCYEPNQKLAQWVKR